MHGRATKPATRYDRKAIMAYAWAMYREGLAALADWDAGLADHLRYHRGFIDAATTDAERARRIAVETRNYGEFHARKPTTSTLGECMRAAWAGAKARPTPPRILTDRDVEIISALMAEQHTTTISELASLGLTHGEAIAMHLI